MKKMTFGIIFVLVLIIFVFAGCLSFKTPDVDVNGTETSSTLEEYETIIAAAMGVPVTDANGENETNAAGETVTETVIAEVKDVPVTNAAGENVTNAAGEQETAKVYVAADSGKIIDNAVDIKTTQAYKNKDTGEVVATTAPTADKTTEKTTSGTANAPSNTLPTTQPTQQNTNENEFEYLRSGNFYIQGTMTDSSGEQFPLEMAVTDNSVYMLSDFEGASMGMLISDGTTYMIYPAEKSYLELSAGVLKAMGMDSEDLLNSSDLNYAQYSLSNADSTATENVNGRNCTVYIYNSSTGSTRFFMDGNKLVRFATYDTSGKPDTVNDVSYITKNVPEDKITPPKDYKEYKGITGMFSFISLLGDLI